MTDSDKNQNWMQEYLVKRCWETNGLQVLLHRGLHDKGDSVSLQWGVGENPLTRWPNSASPVTDQSNVYLLKWHNAKYIPPPLCGILAKYAKLNLIRRNGLDKSRCGTFLQDNWPGLFTNVGKNTGGWKDCSRLKEIKQTEQTKRNLQSSRGSWIIL